MKRTLRWMALAALCAGLLLSGGCAAAEGVQVLRADELFSERDLRQSYEAAGAVTISLSGEGASCNSEAVVIEGSRIVIGTEGVYVLTGTLSDGQVVVSAGEKDEVQLVLSGADITSGTSAAIYCLSADKVFLTLEEGTQNVLANGGSFVAIDENNIDAAVFAKTDLTLSGAGSLTVSSPAGHGIVSKDELTITGGTYGITAAGHGMTGKDGVAIAAGSFAIVSGKDGIHAEHEDAQKGFLYAADGSFAIESQGDALSASGAMQIDGGTYALTAGGGSAGVTMSTGDAMQRGGFRSFDQSMAPVQEGENAQSCKGIKADGQIVIHAGTFTLDTADDAVHGGADITIAGGKWSIRTGDDAIHADAAVRITDGEFDIPTCYEGVEGQSVSIEGGTLVITAYDDGLNAAGGADASGWGFGFGRQDEFAAVDGCEIVISGGSITIVSGGDSIDSNGALTVSGGTLDLTCNGNGNTAIDTNGTFAHTGGEIVTNDGSENGSGGMGGGKGRGSRMGGGQRREAP